MARINKSALTKAEIISEATKQFLEKGYSNTTISAIAKELGMSPGNLTFHYPTKEHLLAELTDMLCAYQWDIMEKETDEGLSSVMAICLELTTMASASEEDEIIRDFFLSVYSNPICLDIIRKNDTERAKKVFRNYRPDWTDEQFVEAEILVSGIEYATLMTTDASVSLEARITGALHSICAIYGIPEETRNLKLQKVFAMDYKNICKRVLAGFKAFVEKSNEHTFRDLLNR